MAEQLVDAAVVEMAVVEIVLFRQPLRPPRPEDLPVDGGAHGGHLLLGDERERSEPALLVIEADVVFTESVLAGSGHGCSFIL